MLWLRFQHRRVTAGDLFETALDAVPARTSWDELALDQAPEQTDCLAQSRLLFCGEVVCDRSCQPALAPKPIGL
jgi:hypothetical protein